MNFHSVGNVIIPTDELSLFRGVGIPPTRWDNIWDDTGINIGINIRMIVIPLSMMFCSPNTIPIVEGLAFLTLW